MSSNPMPRSARSFAFLASSQAKTFTQDSVAQCVPNRHTLASAKLCPETIYPARAGETVALRDDAVDRGVHPRACGGNASGHIVDCFLVGPSPRVRGKPHTIKRYKKILRSIPARAGETPTTSRLTSHETVHPRACGGNLVGMSGSSGVTGPSPRVRGKHVLRHEAVVPERSIPARAGETRTTQTSRLLPQVHPRACGGNYEELSEGTGEPGPSPRVRRKPGTEGTGRRAEGSIPARAGKPMPMLTS